MKELVWGDYLILKWLAHFIYHPYCRSTLNEELQLCPFCSQPFSGKYQIFIDPKFLLLLDRELLVYHGLVCFVFLFLICKNIEYCITTSYLFVYIDSSFTNSVVDDKFVRDSVKFSNKTSSTFGQAFSDFTSPRKGKILPGLNQSSHPPKKYSTYSKPNHLLWLIEGKETSGAVVDIEAEVKDVDWTRLGKRLILLSTIVIRYS